MATKSVIVGLGSLQEALDRLDTEHPGVPTAVLLRALMRMYAENRIDISDDDIRREASDFTGKRGRKGKSNG